MVAIVFANSINGIIGSSVPASVAAPMSSARRQDLLVSPNHSPKPIEAALATASPTAAETMALLGPARSPTMTPMTLTRPSKTPKMAVPVASFRFLCLNMKGLSAP